MNKKKIFIVSFLILILTAGAAFGGQVVKQAILSDITLLTNGFETQEEVYIIDGSSFLPVKSVSTLLGAEVGWDSKKREINLITYDDVIVDPEYIDGLLAEIDSLKSQVEELENQTVDIVGQTPNKEYTTAKYTTNMDSRIVTTYEDVWGSGEAFSLKGQIFSDGVTGIKFNPIAESHYSKGYQIKVDNKSYKKEFRMTVGKDDLSPNTSYSIRVIGYSPNTGYINITNQINREETNLYKTFVLNDVSSFEDIYFSIYPKVRSQYSNTEEQTEKLDTYSENKYLLIFEPKLK